jgi:hypothetical protein
VQLNLDIIIVGASALLGTGAALVAPSCEARQARPGSRNTAEVQDGSSRNLRGPMHAACKAGWGNRHRKPQAFERARRSSERVRTRNHEQHAEPGSESISNRVADMGSRSALVVPLTPGNLALGDPVEGRGAPPRQNRRWETRRAL